MNFNEVLAKERITKTNPKAAQNTSYRNFG
jgi:hypothetical protein